MNRFHLLTIADRELLGIIKQELIALNEHPRNKSDELVIRDGFDARSRPEYSLYYEPEAMVSYTGKSPAKLGMADMTTSTRRHMQAKADTLQTYARGFYYGWESRKKFANKDE